jgi:UDP-glucose 4-epimerase
MVDERWKNQRVLVTGGAGFIGSHLVRRLLDQDAAVVVLDDLSSGSRAQVPDGAELIVGGVECSEAVEQASAGCTTILHLAAQVSVPEAEGDPESCRLVNVQGTGNVVAAAVSRSARFVLASTCAVYGDPDSIPTPESTTVQPLSVYGHSKAMAESIVCDAIATDGLRGGCLRLFNVVGHGQNVASAYAAVVPRFADCLRAGRPPTIEGDGLQTRDFVPVDFVVECLLQTAIEPAERVVNVGTGRETSLLELLQRMQEIVGTALQPTFTVGRVGDIRRSAADVERLHSQIGSCDPSRLDQALRDVLRQESTTSA